MNNLNRNGYASRDEIAAVGALELHELSQSEFKDATDARNGELTTVGLERLRAAAQRQAAARQPVVISEAEHE
ncbi:MAG: hypothetical protein WCB99_09855 [Candidatus Cybelea sp.]